MMPIARPLELSMEIEAALGSLGRGEPILIFDSADREGETDLVLLSHLATPDLVRLLRRDAGGLLCTALSFELKERIGLPFASDLLEIGAVRYPVLAGVGRRAPRYDLRTAFGISVNHRTNYTGIPDNDRAATIRALGVLAAQAPGLSDAELAERFAREFSSPGHVPLLHSARGLLRERKGHTELSISLARMGSYPESTTVCEMLGDSGGARSVEAARRYARDHGWPFLDGATIAEAYERWSA
ncbi:MAG TPA: 3,4-dihydroxy-2-butanone-4-phosphate synthase [Thermoplasmata archaeon]|nr:3,4-dihydroxy-2-butanone-4-phosphate synthase [Thermoplasmata archaeon]